MEMLKQCLAIGLAGSLGALARFFVGTQIQNRATSAFGMTFPLGTMIVNLSGCFILGFFLTAVEERTISMHVKLAVATGFVGAYTTFSTWMYDSFKLLEKGEVNSFLMNLFASLLLGLAAVWLGAICGRRI
jgi:CrcB protein